MGHDHSRTRRVSPNTPAWEALESRQLMTGGAGSIFAIVSGEIVAPDVKAEIRATIHPDNFTTPSGRMILGIDVAPAGGSTAKPTVSAVEGDANIQVRGLMRSTYSPFVQGEKVVTNAPSSAVVVPVTLRTSDQAGTLVTRVQGTEQTTGKFLAGYYLPGDTNDDGKVDLTDINTIRAGMNTIAGESTYKFDADANRDGKISGIDLKIAQANQGVQTTIRPVITANLDPVSDSGPRDRTTIYQDVTFTGQATPGTRITFEELNGKTASVSTTAGADGNYSIRVTLAEGENKFRVTSMDSFGQTIGGEISPVKYIKPLVPVESPLPPQPAGQVGTPSTPAPDQGSARLKALEQRFPNAFKQLRPDQAQNLRVMLSKAPTTK